MDLELTVVQRAKQELGYIAGLAIGEQLIAAAGGTSSHAPTVLVSSDARHFEPRKTPRQLGLRDVAIAGEVLWICGEYGQLALSRDRGATWKLFDTGTDVCLFALALAPDGAVWVVGDAGYVARVYDERLERIDFKTTARLAAIYCIRDEAIALGFDGLMIRWRAGVAAKIQTGATKPLTALTITKHGSWLLTGDGGFVARSPDGAWFSRVKSGVEIDIEAITSLADGRVVMVGDRGIIMVSADDGRTWTTIATELVSHLWSVEKFGAQGALITGDEGLIIKLAPPGDETWSDRINVFGGVKPLDTVFAAGPEGFIGKLPAYVAAIECEPLEDDTGSPSANEFAKIYGAPLPAEVEALFAATKGRDCFEELRLDAKLLRDVGDENLFERLLAAGLTDAFCGVFCIGAQDNGDTYHMELYEWDGPRQVLHYDHETHVFTGVVADSLDSLVYLAALARAKETRQISEQAFDIALRKLRGKVAPTWHFGIEDHDPEFVPLDAKRRDTEFFFYRSRWIVALLENHELTDVTDIPALFMPDFNQILPEDQLAARFEACEKVIPTALYSMWRAYLFDEPELARYLEIGRRHKSRLVRDAAKLVDELRDGRNELGTIKDMRSRLAAFRALDLDPRRADQRKAEAEAREQADATRRRDVDAELARVPRTAWPELAWRWLEDGIAQRALLEKMAEVPELAAQIAMLDELRGLPDDERELVLPRLAGELAPEIEALLVGSLVRDDDLGDVLAVAHEDDGDDDEDDEGGEDEPSPGWNAIEEALAPIYKGAEPHAHYGTVVPYALGGNDPLQGISVYLRDEPVPHFHIVTYGFTDLFAKDTDDPDVSGFGFELTLRVARAAGDTKAPEWTLGLLQNLARYVFTTGNRFAIGHKMGLNGPIAVGLDTKLTALLFAEDPELGAFESEFGEAQFIQVVGITDDEYQLIQEWSTTGLVEILKRKLPLLVTDLARDSVLADPALAEEVRRRVDAEGSSEDMSFAGDMDLSLEGGRVRIEMGALYAASLPRAMRGRLRHGRDYVLRGRDAVLRLVPGPAVGAAEGEDELSLALSPDVIAEIDEQLRAVLAGTYRFESWPALEIVVTPTIIRDQSGAAITVRGVADPAEVARLVAEANAAAEDSADAEEEPDEDEDEEPDEDEDEDDDDDQPSERQIRAALAMTERALRISPDDDDTQFTHAMLMLDADRAGIEGTLDRLLAALPAYTLSNRVNIAVRMAKQDHPRFADAVDTVLAAGSFPDDEVADELIVELADGVIERAPEKLEALVPMLPANVNLLSSLAWKAVQAEEREQAIAIYERLLELPIPEEGDERTNYLRALNNACVQAHAAKAYDAAVRIADRAQPVAHENPYIYHSAACAYAAVGNYAKALEQVKLAIAHDYDHVGKVEVDSDLGPLLEWPEFKALFRDWHARREGN